MLIMRVVNSTRGNFWYTVCYVFLAPNLVNKTGIKKVRLDFHKLARNQQLTLHVLVVSSFQLSNSFNG